MVSAFILDEIAVVAAFRQVSIRSFAIVNVFCEKSVNYDIMRMWKFKFDKEFSIWKNSVKT